LTLNISEMAKDTAIVTMESEWEFVGDLSNGAISNDWTNPNAVFKVTLLFGTSVNDLEWSLSQIPRSRYYSASNNSQMVQDRAIVTMAD